MAISEKKEEVKNRFLEKQMEKSFYLNEFKERVLVSLSIKSIESGHTYPEIIQALYEPDVEVLKMRRDINLKFLKPYIEIAEKLGKRYTLVDSLGLQGDIGLVIISSEEFDNEHIDTKVKSLAERFKENGLEEYYAKHLGKKICSRHYNEVKKKFPIMAGSFQEFSFFNKFFGAVCPICQEEKNKNKIEKSNK